MYASEICATSHCITLGHDHAGLPVAMTKVADVLDGIPDQQVDLRNMMEKSCAALMSLSWASFVIYTFALSLCTAHVFVRRWEQKTREAALYYFGIAAPLLMVVAALVQLLTIHLDSLWGTDVDAAAQKVRLPLLPDLLA